MSYHRTPSRVVARYRRPAMGDVASWFDAAAIQADLDKACPPSSAVNTMKAQIADLDATWHPTGYYAWNDMGAVIAATVTLAGKASDAAITFFSGSSTPAAKDYVRRAADRYNEIAKQSIDYTLAWKAAKAAGKPVEAPGFKQWVVDDLRAAADLMRAVETQVCGAPWWLGTVTGVSTFFIDTVNVARRVTGVVLKIGEGALKAVERTSGILGFLIGVAPFAALGVGAFIVFQHVKKKL